MSNVEEQRLEVVAYIIASTNCAAKGHTNLTVYKAFDSRTQVDVAWNSIELSTMTDNEKNKVFLECEMLQKLNHENILKIRDKWKNEEREELCFVTDIIQNGSLRIYFKVCAYPSQQHIRRNAKQQINSKERSISNLSNKYADKSYWHWTICIRIM